MNELQAILIIASPYILFLIAAILFLLFKSLRSKKSSTKQNGLSSKSDDAPQASVMAHSDHVQFIGNKYEVARVNEAYEHYRAYYEASNKGYASSAINALTNIRSLNIDPQVQNQIKQQARIDALNSMQVQMNAAQATQGLQNLMGQAIPYPNIPSLQQILQHKTLLNFNTPTENKEKKEEIKPNLDGISITY